jgi:hypothetical protein
MKIDAILSDYDGTLCPTSSISQDNSNSSIIPKRLETIIWNISEKIDICIVSSKDFGFLHRRTKFAKILSCIMGIETLVLKRHNLKAVMRENQYQYDNDDDSSSNNNNNNINNKTNTSFGECKDKLQCILSSHIPSNKDILQDNSQLLDSLADEISINFKDITVERKFTSDNQILAGITIDYRHLKHWQSYKRNIEPHLKYFRET